MAVDSDGTIARLAEILAGWTNKSHVSILRRAKNNNNNNNNLDEL